MPRAGADAVVLPTRGEGWGRPQMEALVLGRPLITTNWSGPTAYISDRVAYPLAIEGLSAAAEGEAFCRMILLVTDYPRCCADATAVLLGLHMPA